MSKINSAVQLPHLWRLKQSQRVLHKQWDEEFVVFNDVSGACHLLDDGAFAILEVLLDHPQGIGTASLATELTLLLGESEAVEMEYLALMLANLVACELVEASQ